MDGTLETDMQSEWSSGIYDESGEIGKPPKALKRGDACLACRKRRIRCTAEKPSCATCVRLRKECVYETVQAPSRIAKLKDRIAELENQVTGMSQSAAAAASNAATGSTTALPLGPYDPSFSFSYPPAHMTFPTNPTPVHLHTDIPSMNQDDVGIPSSSHYDGIALPSSVPQPNYLPQSDFHHAQSSSMAHTLPEAQSSNPRPLQPPDPNFSFDYGLLDSTMLGLSSTFDMSATLAVPTPPAPYNPPTPSTPTSGAFEKLRQISMRPDQAPFLEDTAERSSSSVNLIQTPEYSSGLMNYPEDSNSSLSRFTDLPAHSPQNALSGGWFEADDVPTVVRDHLFDLYFSKTSIFHSAINIPRFYTRLTLPPSKRPHMSLIYMMYLYGCRASDQHSLRNLESRFYELAQAKITQGLREGDRPLDVVRALTLMTGYLFAKEWYNLGYIFVGQAVRLAVACGLHRIPSGVWTPPVNISIPVLHTLRANGYALAPPEDAVELGERIQAFWSVYELDQCTFVSYHWDPILQIQNVLTPLPRPMQEYGVGMVSRVDDVRAASVFGPPPPGWDPRRQAYFGSLRMRALTLLAAAVHLRTVPVEPGHTHDVPGYVLGYRSPTESHPQEQGRLLRALERFRSELPPGYALPWRTWDEGEFTPLRPMTRSTQSAAINFIIASAYIQVWSVRSLNMPNTRAVLVARRMALLISVHVNESVASEAGSVIAGYGAFFLNLWDSAARILVREIKRLEILDRIEDAGILRIELAGLTGNITHWATVHKQHTGDTMDVAALNVKMHNHLLATPLSEWRESQREAESRFL